MAESSLANQALIAKSQAENRKHPSNSALRKTAANCFINLMKRISQIENHFSIL